MPLISLISSHPPPHASEGATDLILSARSLQSVYSSCYTRKFVEWLVCVFYPHRAKVLLHEWDGLRRFYNWAITQNVKNVIDRHVRVLFHGPDFTCPHKSSIHRVRSSSSLVELDDVYIK